MTTKKVYEGFSICNNYSTVGHKRFYSTIEKASEALVIHSIHFNRKPWGGSSEGAVFNTSDLSISAVTYIRQKNQNIVLESDTVFMWNPAWRKPRIDDYGIHESFKKSYLRRWRWCWDNIEDENGVKRKDRR